MMFGLGDTSLEWGLGARLLSLAPPFTACIPFAALVSTMKDEQVLAIADPKDREVRLAAFEGAHAFVGGGGWRRTKRRRGRRPKRRRGRRPKTRREGRTKKRSGRPRWTLNRN